MSERGVEAVRPSRLDRFAIERLRMRRLPFAYWSQQPGPSRLDRFAIERLRMRRLAFAYWSQPPSRHAPNPLMLRCSGAKRPSLEARTVRLRRKS